MGCAREGGVGTEVRVVGYGRKSSPKVGDIKIRGFFQVFCPRAPLRSMDMVEDSGAKKIPVDRWDVAAPIDVFHW